MYAFSAEKKGYSGTLIASKVKPISVVYGIKDTEGVEFDKEGRIITAEYEDYYIGILRRTFTAQSRVISLMQVRNSIDWIGKSPPLIPYYNPISYHYRQPERG